MCVCVCQVPHFIYYHFNKKKLESMVRSSSLLFHSQRLAIISSSSSFDLLLFVCERERRDHPSSSHIMNTPNDNVK